MRRSMQNNCEIFFPVQHCFEGLVVGVVVVVVVGGGGVVVVVGVVVVGGGVVVVVVVLQFLQCEQ